MCARRFLIVIFVLTLLVVVGAFAIFQFGGRVLLRQATPMGRFEPAKAGDAPDYAKAENWIAREDFPGDPSRWRPSNDEPVVPFALETQVFYVHPTTYLLTDRWNAPLRAGADTDARTRLFVQSQPSAFNQNALVWAPRYRQAAYGAFLLNSADARKALDFAFADVAAAFEQFLREIPPESPIILAGHSQGGLHVSRLLERYREQLKGRLVAAYVVGWPLSVAADLPAMGLPPCTRRDQAGCVLSWQTFSAPANPSLIIDAWEGTDGPTGIKRKRADMLCVNPITGTRGGQARDSEGNQMLEPTADLADAKLVPGIGASCQDGLLVLGSAPHLRGFVLPGNNYHVYDFSLFWEAVRHDAESRITAWYRS